MTTALERVNRLVAGLPRRLRTLRTPMMTRKELARRTGIDVNLLRRIESGQAPSLEQLLLITQELGVTLWELLGSYRYGRPAARVRRLADAADVEWELPLHPHAAKPVKQTLPVGRQDAAVRHDGTEWLLIVAGAVEVTLLALGETPNPVRLTAGDELDFDASIEHVVTNIGDVPAVLYRLFDTSGTDAHVSTATTRETELRVQDSEQRPWQSQPASIRVTAIGHRDSELRWLSQFTLPAAMEIEVVDLGRRADVVVTHGEVQVAISADFLANEWTLQRNDDPDSAIIDYAMLLVRAMQEAYDPASVEKPPRVRTVELPMGEWFSSARPSWPRETAEDSDDAAPGDPLSG